MSGKKCQQPRRISWKKKPINYYWTKWKGLHDFAIRQE